MARKRRGAVRKTMSSNAHLSPFAFGNALGITGVISLVFYALVVWLGGFNGGIITQQYPLSFSFTSWTIIIGLIETYAMGYVLGWILAKVYNRSLNM